MSSLKRPHPWTSPAEARAPGWVAEAAACRGWRALGLIRRHMPAPGAQHVTTSPLRPLRAAPAPHLSLLSFKRHPRPRGYRRADSAVTGPGISRAASCPLVLAGDKGRMSPRPLPRGLQLPPSLRAQPPVCHRVLRGTGLLGCAWIMAHEQGPGLGTAEDFSLGKRSSWTPPVAPSTGQRRVVTIKRGYRCSR